MAQYQRTIDNFVALTKDTNLRVSDKIQPAIITEDPGFTIIDNETGERTWRSLNLNDPEVTFTSKDAVEMNFFPAGGGTGPWSMTMTAQVPNPDWTEDDYVWGVRGKPAYLVKRITYEFHAHETKVFQTEPNAVYTLTVMVRENPVKPAEVFFRTAEFKGGYWESTRIPLSVLLLEIRDVQVNKFETGTAISNRVANRKAQRVGEPPTIDTDEWSVKFIGVSGTEDVTEWSTGWPSRREIDTLRINAIRIRLETKPDKIPKDGISNIVIYFTEYYATENPATVSRHGNSNLYIPRLRVEIDGFMDVSRFVSTFNGNSLELVVPDTRFEEYLHNNPRIDIHLDGNPAFTGRVKSIKNRKYGTGVKYTLTCTTLFDMLGEKMDKDVLTAVVDSTGKAALEFNDDAGYIAFITENTPGVNVQPIYYAGGDGFRPISIWYQGSTDNTVRRLVQLDADYDWYQVYSTQNQTVRGKLRDVAHANRYSFTSVAGFPALIPMVQQPDKSLKDLELAVRFNTVEGGNLYLPDARLYVPEYVLDMSEVPSEIEVLGLETIDGREDMLYEEKQPIYWRDEGEGGRGNPVFRIESRGSDYSGTDRGWHEYMFCDENGVAMAVQSGTIDVIKPKRKTDFDLNLRKDLQNPEIEYIHSSERPEYVGDGIEGTIGVRMRLSGGMLIYGYYQMELNGHIIYTATGERGDPPKAMADGAHLPVWAKTPKNFAQEMGEYAHAFPKDKETIENDFLPTYHLPKTDDELADWNEELRNQGKPLIYAKKGEHYTATIGNYEVSDADLSKLADAHVLERILKVLTIELKYIGHLAVKKGDFIGIARRPAEGLYAPITHTDVFQVLEDFQINFTAGGSVHTSTTCGYVGTLTGIAQNNEVRDVRSVNWQEPKPPVDDAFYF